MDQLLAIIVFPLSWGYKVEMREMENDKPPSPVFINHQREEFHTQMKRYPLHLQTEEKSASVSAAMVSFSS